MPEGGSELAAIAHVLRRTSFGPFPGATEAALDAHGSAAKVLEAQLDADPVPFDAPAKIDDPFDVNDEATGNEALVNYWLSRVASDEAGLHEKMMWFWHCHFPVSFMKSAGLYCWQMLRDFHEHALGNFGDLTKAVTISPAMLQYLDGAGSAANDPNENYARELMELFTLGRDQYTQADIAAAARALAGFEVNPAEAKVGRRPTAMLHEPVTFLGKTEVFDVDSVVDRILEQDAAAPFIVEKLARHFVGGEPDPGSIADWAKTFRDSGYEIRPVIEEMLRSSDFERGTMNRSKHGLEWLCSMVRATGIEMPTSHMFSHFAQAPFYPPNVGGWPDTWGSASSLYARAGFLYSADIDADVLSTPDDPVDDTLAHCGLYDVSASTRAAVQATADDGADHVKLLRVALTAPEYARS